MPPHPYLAVYLPDRVLCTPELASEDQPSIFPSSLALSLLSLPTSTCPTSARLPRQPTPNRIGAHAGRGIQLEHHEYVLRRAKPISLSKRTKRHLYPSTYSTARVALWVVAMQTHAVRGSVSTTGNRGRRTHTDCNGYCIIYSFPLFLSFSFPLPTVSSRGLMFGAGWFNLVSSDACATEQSQNEPPFFSS